MSGDSPNERSVIFRFSTTTFGSPSSSLSFRPHKWKLLLTMCMFTCPSLHSNHSCRSSCCCEKRSASRFLDHFPKTSIPFFWKWRNLLVYIRWLTTFLIREISRHLQMPDDCYSYLGNGIRNTLFFPLTSYHWYDGWSALIKVTYYWFTRFTQLTWEKWLCNEKVF